MNTPAAPAAKAGARTAGPVPGTGAATRPFRMTRDTSRPGPVSFRPALPARTCLRAMTAAGRPCGEHSPPQRAAAGTARRLFPGTTARPRAAPL